MTDKILKPTLIILAILNIADYKLTLRAVYALGATEANPLMDMALGTPMFAIIKLIVVPLFCYFLWIVRDKWQSKLYIARLLSFVFIAYSGVTLWHIYGQFFM